MGTVIMAVMLEPRNENAPKVQEILTKYGCIIKTRLGLHEVTGECCSQKGLILLQLYAKEEEISNLHNELTAVKEVTAKTMTI